MLKAADKMQTSMREVLSSVINESHNTDISMSKLSSQIQDVYASTEKLSAGKGQKIFQVKQVL